MRPGTALAHPSVSKASVPRQLRTNAAPPGAVCGKCAGSEAHAAGPRGHVHALARLVADELAGTQARPAGGGGGDAAAPGAASGGPTRWAEG